MKLYDENTVSVRMKFLNKYIFKNNKWVDIHGSNEIMIMEEGWFSFQTFDSAPLVWIT